MTGLAVLTSGAASPSAGAEAVAKAPVVQGLTARQGLAVLKVKGRAPKTGYARDQFGPAWSDVDGNTCDTRNDVLRRDLADITVADDWCIVLTGVLTDPYGREMISFRRGTKTSAAVQVDHVVALADAGRRGADPVQDGSPALRQRPVEPAGHVRRPEPQEAGRRRSHLAATA